MRLPTDYSKYFGISTSADSSSLGYSTWLLRYPGSNISKVSPIGSLLQNQYVNNWPESGIVPAICFNNLSLVVEMHLPGEAVNDNYVYPTCTENGSYDSTVFCMDCGIQLSKERIIIPKLGHDLVHVNAKKPSTTEVGWEAYDYCTRCSYSTYVEIPKLDYTIRKGNTFKFGSYPQSRVDDVLLINELNSIPGEWNSYNYYKQGQQSNFMVFKDVDYDGEKYRCVKFTEYRNFYTNSDVIPGGGKEYQQQQNGYETNVEYWFRFDPIIWKILDVDSGLCVSNLILDSQQFYHQYTTNFIDLDYYQDASYQIYLNSYKYSDVRAFLNDSFYNVAFTSTQKNQIGLTTISSNDYTDRYIVNNEDVEDYVFLLSCSDAMDIDKSERSMQGTDYAKVQGLYVEKNTSVIDAKNKSSWWLRSAGSEINEHYVYDNDGHELYTQSDYSAAPLMIANTGDIQWEYSQNTVITTKGVVPAASFVNLEYIMNHQEYEETTLTVDNYTLQIENVNDLNLIRYAMGQYDTGSQIKNAPDCVTLNTRIINNYTQGNSFTWDFSDGGIYSLYLRFDSGEESVVIIDVTNMMPSIRLDGLNLTVNNLYGVKDFFVAYGNGTNKTYCQNNLVVQVTQNKIQGAKSYKYTLPYVEDGEFTIFFRYDSGVRSDGLTSLYINNVSASEGLTPGFKEHIDRPSFSILGLTLSITDMTDVKTIRIAPGTWNTNSEIKSATGYIGYSVSAIQKQDPTLSSFSIKFSEKKVGPWTCIVLYNNGYYEIFKYNVTKLVPTITKDDTSITFSELENLDMIRWAPGKTTRPKEVPGNQIVKAKDIDLTQPYTIGNLSDIWSFLIQYVDGSQTIKTYSFTDIN